MNSEQPWKKLLDRVKVEGRLAPVTDEKLDAFEAARKIKLPRSYRGFCKVFGPGSLRGRIWIHITTPGRKVSDEGSIEKLTKESIEVLNEEIWSTIFLDYEVYCPNPELIRKSLFFGSDIYTHHYFWNPTEITDKPSDEMAVYVIYREMEIHRLADSFESFVFDICLDKGIPGQGKLDFDPPLFQAASRV